MVNAESFGQTQCRQCRAFLLGSASMAAFKSIEMQMQKDNTLHMTQPQVSPTIQSASSNWFPKIYE